MRILLLKKILDSIVFITEKIRDLRTHLILNNSLSKRDLKILSKNKKLHNIHKGKRGFVIANGPSLKKMDIDFIKNEISFTVNSFFRYKNIHLWQPTYSLVLDPNLFVKATISDSSFYKDFASLMPKTKLIAPIFRGYKVLNKNKDLDNIDIYYTSGGGSRDLDLDFCKVIPSFQGVAAYALATAINAGCNPIYLVGFDHDYMVSRGKDKHFFEGPSIQSTNKKFNEKFVDVKLSDIIPYDVELMANYKLWQDYRYLLKIAKKRGIKIYNSTAGGFLDVFERFNFENIDK
jgi:hypothetical protein